MSVYKIFTVHTLTLAYQSGTFSKLHLSDVRLTIISQYKLGHGRVRIYRLLERYNKLQYGTLQKAVTYSRSADGADPFVIGRG